MNTPDKIYDEYCAKCKLNDGREDDNINCRHVGKLIKLDFQVCAACNFTDQAWNKFYEKNPQLERRHGN